MRDRVHIGGQRLLWAAARRSRSGPPVGGSTSLGSGPPVGGSTSLGSSPPLAQRPAGGRQHIAGRRPAASRFAPAARSPRADARTIDRAMTTFRDRFAWHPEPDLIGMRDEAASREALRAAGAAAWEAALDEFRERLAPHTVSAYHPRSYGYFTPPPLVASVLGELLAQVAQQGIDLFHAGPSGALVEEEVVRWLCDLVGYGEGSFGLLTSGGVMANFIAMALVRDIHLPRLCGAATPPRGRALERVRVYTSDQTHFSIARALDELGFPADTLAILPADDDFRLRAGPVAAAIAFDRAQGITPAAISAVAGATNTGSIDALPELADLAAVEGLWLHVDAAYGAAARFSDRERHLLGGLERADSVTVDPHKWLFQAYDIGGLVVREGSALGATFGGRAPEYYRHGHGGDRAPRLVEDAHGHDDPADINFWKLGFEGTRRWRALKLWLSWKHVGSSGFARLVEQNLDVARHLARTISASDDFEACPVEPPLSVVCFRHLPAGRAATAALTPLGRAELDAHQDRLQRDLERSGRGWLSTTRLRGATWLRAGVVNTQSIESDADDLLGVLRDIAVTGSTPN
jgi:aromatic-L-amino-acid decarboxylase